MNLNFTIQGCMFKAKYLWECKNFTFQQEDCIDHQSRQKIVHKFLRQKDYVKINLSCVLKMFSFFYKHFMLYKQDSKSENDPNVLNA